MSSAQCWAGYVIAGGDTSSPELLDAPRGFEYQVINAAGEVATVSYRSLPPGPAHTGSGISLDFYGGKIRPYDYLEACGQLQQNPTPHIAVMNSGDSIQTFPTTRVLLVRHGEPQSGGANPSLAPAGLTRAQALADLATAAGVQSVFATDFCRTAQTAQPTAAQLDLTLAIQPLGSGNGLANCTPPISVPSELKPSTLRSPPALGNYLLGGEVPQPVLVVSHSNLVLAMVEALGGDWPCPASWPRGADNTCQIPPTEFNHLFWVAKAPQASFAHVDHQTY